MTPNLLNTLWEKFDGSPLAINKLIAMFFGCTLEECYETRFGKEFKITGEWVLEFRRLQLMSRNLKYRDENIKIPGLTKSAMLNGFVFDKDWNWFMYLRDKICEYHKLDRGFSFEIKTDGVLIEHKTWDNKEGIWNNTFSIFNSGSVGLEAGFKSIGFYLFYHLTELEPNKIEEKV